MSYCNNCGAANPDGVRFCSNCGAALQGGLPPVGGVPALYGPPVIRPDPPAPDPPQPVDPVPDPPQPYTPRIYPQQPTYPMTVSSTGTIVWASILIFFGLFFLLHLPFAIVGVVLAAGINNRMPPDVQQQKLKSARIWCIVSTVILVLTVLLFALIFGLVLAEEF